MARFYYFPRPYPDELIGSVVLRASLHRATPLKCLTELLTGRRRSYLTLSMSPWLPQIAHASGMDAEELLWENTFFPYITRFMSQVDTDKFAVYLLGGTATGNSALTQSGTQGSPGHRFCFACLQEDEMKYGEAYWHRQHNLPMVTYCQKHRCPLMVFKPSFKKWTPNSASINQLPPARTSEHLASLISTEIAYEISHQSSECLAAKDRKEPVEWYRHYRLLLYENGFPHHGEGLANLLLAIDFEDVFGRVFLEQAKLDFRRKDRPWIALMAQENTAISFATPKHMLMNTYLKLMKSVERRPSRKPFYPDPGRRPRDYGALDESYVIKVEMAIAEVKRKNIRVGITEMLTDLGIWATYRHHQESLPKTKAILREFRKTENSARQVGKRKRKYMKKLDDTKV